MTTVTDFEVAPNSRVTVHDNPNMAPGKCCMCGDAGSDERKFIDFGMQLDVYGAVYFCDVCLTEVSRAVGFIPMKPMEILVSSNLFLLNQRDELLLRIEGLKDASRILFADCACGDFGDGSSVDHPDKPYEGSEETAGADSVGYEPVGLERLGSLYDATGDDE